MKTRKHSIRPALLLATLAVAVTFSVILISFPEKAISNNVSEEVKDLLVKRPVPVRTFQLTDHNQKPFDKDRLKGVWTLLFFGYTHCPDVCPTTLTELDNAASRLKNQSNAKHKLQYVFVSIDPKRDTPQLLSEYISYFGAKFIAVTGEHEQLKQLANPLGVQYKIGIGFNKEYLVEHSSAMLLIDPEGRYYARFKAPHYAEEIVSGFKSLKKYYGENG